MEFEEMGGQEAEGLLPSGGCGKAYTSRTGMRTGGRR
uniref:Uncharacterized protein n=1 Tax=Rhizophora mucronata TaxID=61149 RepID=A0A2P2NRP6_RHIMU